jgi:inorganic triphosphatase YgiF
MEIELKFRLLDHDRSRLEEVLTARGDVSAPEPTRHEVTRYFDTGDLALFRAGYSLRVRHTQGRNLQTLKSLESAAGTMNARVEREWKVRSAAKPDLKRLTRIPDIAALALDGVKPIFATNIHRTPYLVDLPGSLAELVIDTGEVVAEASAVPVSEIEIELKDGSAATLYAFAAALHSAMPLRITAESKAGRGYRLVRGKKAAIRKASDLDLSPDTTMADGFAAIAGECLGHLIGNIAGLEAGKAEALHQMRVAIRRLRSALVLFAPHLEPNATRLFGDTLRAFGQALGPGRDWDVFLDETLPAATERSDERAWLEQLAAPAQEAQGTAHAGARRLLDAAEFTGFVLAFAGWAEGRLWAAPGEEDLLDQPLSAHAPEMLDRLADKVHKRGRNLEDCSLEELHALRKSIKKLRYGVEYFEGIYPDKPVKDYRRACTSALEMLGLINDTVTTDMIAGTLAEGRRAHLAPAISLLSRHCAERRKDARSALPEGWAILRDAEPFWR